MASRDSEAVPPEAAVRAHLASVLAGTGFANADRLKRFLEFTVEMKLRGEEDQIKEYLLGREVFDRGNDYDPRLDPIVRVEARRLRQRLAEYYSGPGQADTLRIDFPKGSYAPVIRSTAAAVAAVDPRGSVSRRRWATAVAGLAGTAATLAAVLPLFRRQAGPPLLAVVPARWVWGETSTLDSVDESLAEEVTASLARSGSVAVAAWPVVIRQRGRSLEVRALGERLGVQRILIVAVRPQQPEAASGRLRITAFLMDAATGQKKWVEDYPETTPSFDSRRIAAWIAAELPGAMSR